MRQEVSDLIANGQIAPVIVVTPVERRLAGVFKRTGTKGDQYCAHHFDEIIPRVEAHLDVSRDTNDYPADRTFFSCRHNRGDFPSAAFLENRPGFR